LSVRLDKWLQVARVFKTRSQATRACTAGRVRVNDHTAKPHRGVAIGDRVEVKMPADWRRILVVRELRDRPLPKADVPRLFEDLSPPRPRLDPIERVMRATPMRREKGQGRPTKRERRALDRLRKR
jgi:ribosome-associated heat shock protein Hsp15